MKKFVANCKKIRQDRGISIEQITRFSGIPASRIVDFEEGDQNLTVDELEKLLNFYSLTYNEILSYKSFSKTMRLSLIAALLIVLSTAIIYRSQMQPDSNSATNNGVTTAVVESSPTENKADEVDEPNKQQVASQETDATDGQKLEKELEEEKAQDKVTFRFWGNSLYNSVSLPEVQDQDQDQDQDNDKTIDIVPIEQLDSLQPAWLKERNVEHFILNAGTSDIWTPSTIEAYQQLKKEKYNLLGLGTAPEVYEPLIWQVDAKKVGFLSLAGLIHKPNEVAERSRVGLPKAYIKNDVLQIVKDAKSKVDYLFVLIDWGKTWENTPNSAQKQMAETLVQGGADFIVGNHPFEAQDIAFVGETPVFYALGHSVSAFKKEGSYHFVLEVDFTSKLEEIRLKAGKVSKGKLDFTLSPEEKNEVTSLFGRLNQAEDAIKLEYE
ncbi:CapA family protein [Paenibacillus eucommiae]|uniref:Transcriptional regulator with XRE-family HTH domain n=1 Tax=Paenibacillus eucommiae TaxID=1355755 RepID=A0ABS4J260_9BACL|nr:CapA family protein [Paenibacillus eucommiae]MBP1993903.1 transcriptional regulator with XRE-family HTH domain [Paenibacillus eucommiae]